MQKIILLFLLLAVKNSYLHSSDAELSLQSQNLSRKNPFDDQEIEHLQPATKTEVHIPNEFVNDPNCTDFLKNFLQRSRKARKAWNNFVKNSEYQNSKKQ